MLPIPDCITMDPTLLLHSFLRLGIHHVHLRSYSLGPPSLNVGFRGYRSIPVAQKPCTTRFNALVVWHDGIGLIAIGLGFRSPGTSPL